MLVEGPGAGALADVLAEFPSVTGAAARRGEPERLHRHLELVADRWLEVQPRVLPRGDETPTPLHRAWLLLVAATHQVLANGLGLLGVTAPERM